jgi:hypothetical protein
MDLEKFVQYDEESDILMETFDVNVLTEHSEAYYDLVVETLEGKPRRYALIDMRSIAIAGRNTQFMDKETRQRLVDGGNRVKYEKVAFVIDHPTTRFFAKLMHKMGLVQNTAVKDIETKYFKDKDAALAWLKAEVKV